VTTWPRRQGTATSLLRRYGLVDAEVEHVGWEVSWGSGRAGCFFVGEPLRDFLADDRGQQRAARREVTLLLGYWQGLEGRFDRFERRVVRDSQAVGSQTADHARQQGSVDRRT
jgi:hypothetical protein